MGYNKESVQAIKSARDVIWGMPPGYPDEDYIKNVDSAVVTLHRVVDGWESEPGSWGERIDERVFFLGLRTMGSGFAALSMMGRKGVFEGLEQQYRSVDYHVLVAGAMARAGEVAIWLEEGRRWGREQEIACMGRLALTPPMGVRDKLDESWLTIEEDRYRGRGPVSDRYQLSAEDYVSRVADWYDRVRRTPPTYSLLHSWAHGEVAYLSSAEE